MHFTSQKELIDHLKNNLDGQKFRVYCLSNKAQDRAFNSLQFNHIFRVDEEFTFSSFNNKLLFLKKPVVHVPFYSNGYVYIYALYISC